ncbi:MAG: tRNA isopentenyl-2-thiomethyl-A-37 hydroxylase MiaE [Pirellulales bacterium]|jgi:tRNA-(ms[2]io[6]A)-hydroxylase
MIAPVEKSGAWAYIGGLPLTRSTLTDSAPMLHLKSTSSQRWLDQVSENIVDLLIDHAHCEKKAAGTAMNFIFYYVEDEDLCREMTEIVNEELEHFHLVLDILRQRGEKFRRIKPSSYGSRLHQLIRKQEPERAVDRLLVAGLIEARSCERFGLLSENLEDKELADFFGSLFESEARHHAVYVQLAKNYANESTVMQRLDELAVQEAEIIALGDEFPRVHS